MKYPQPEDRATNGSSFMFPVNFITTDRISCQDGARSKKRLLEEMGALLASSCDEILEAQVFDKLIERERLGSTGLGHGIGLPHARMPGVSKACGAFIQLAEGIDYDAIDQKPVDLVFGLLVPEQATEEHLKLLAHLASLFSNQDLCQQLRQERQPERLLNDLLHWESLAASA